MTNISKLQSEAVKEIDEKVIYDYFDNTGLQILGNRNENRPLNDIELKQFLSDQIQKAYEEGYISGIKDEKILRNKTFLSVQSKQK
jgi:hypothetical protein